MTRNHSDAVVKAIARILSARLISLLKKMAADSNRPTIELRGC